MEEQKRNPAAGLSESEQVQVRRQKLADLQAAGNDPFTLTKFPQDAYSADLKEEFKDLPNETDSGKQVALAGRMMSKRVMGKASFAHLRDDKGDIQLYVRRDELGEEPYAAFKKLDVGDIIGVKGEVFRTKTGELSVRATELTLLAKSLRPLPEKFHGLTDTEMRYRQRYVDLIANPEVKDTFVKRSQILKEIRAYLDEKGFLEVDTPILTPFEIGASARPFYTHHNSLNMDMVLRIETELYLKRLIVGGMDRVYEVGRIFRNEGMDPKHNPEFTSIELYQAFTDFHGMMDLVEELYKRLALKICGSMVIPYQGKQIDMGHWERLTMIEAVKKYSGVDFNDWKSDEDAIASAKEHHVELPEVPTKGAILAEFFDAFVEDKLIQPTFIYDYPVEISPLAKRKPDDPAFTERFEYFIDCTEYGNAFSELNDPIDQKGRFERQVAERKAIEPECKAQVDYDYVNALEYGLPPTGGLGFGVGDLGHGVGAGKDDGVFRHGDGTVADKAVKAQTGHMQHLAWVKRPRLAVAGGVGIGQIALAVPVHLHVIRQQRIQAVDLRAACADDLTVAVPIKQQVRQHGFPPDKRGHLQIRLVMDQAVQRMFDGFPAAFVRGLIHMKGQAGDGFGDHAHAGVNGRNLNGRAGAD